MTLPAPSQQTEEHDWQDENAELFTERTLLMEASKELLLVEEPDVMERRQIRRTTRRLDEINTHIITLNIGLVRGYTRRFTSNSASTDIKDFEAAGLVGLMKAIATFEPERGKFGGWAYKYIQREVLRAVRDADFTELNRGDFEVRPAILAAVETLQVEDPDNIPTDAEIAEEANVTVGQVQRVLRAPTLESIQGRADDDEDSNPGDTIASSDLDVEASVVTAGVLEALKTYGLGALGNREAYVLVRRFGLDNKPAEKLMQIGESMGLSREAVRQIESKAMAKIQHPVILRRIVRQGRK